MARRKTSSARRSSAPAKKSRAKTSRKSSGSTAKKRATVKRANASTGGSVKLVLEHAGSSAVARPDGIAGAFDLSSTPKKGRARL